MDKIEELLTRGVEENLSLKRSPRKTTAHRQKT